MPFPIVGGLPSITSKATEGKLRLAIVAALSAQGVRQDWTHPIFIRDRLSVAKRRAEGSSAIFVQLTTGLFGGMSVRKANKIAPQAVKAVCDAVDRVYRGRYIVEGAVVGWNPRWHYITEHKH